MYDSISLVCVLTAVEKLLAMIFILKDKAAQFFNPHGRTCRTYEDCSLTLRKRYTNCDKRARILAQCKGIRFSEKLSKIPNSSEMEVFLNFTAILSNLQKQLDTPYHADRYFSYQLLTAVDMPDIQAILRDLLPRTSEQSIARIANRMSEKNKTAGSDSSSSRAFNVESSDVTADTDDENEVNYTLVQSYSSEAKKTVQPAWKSGYRGNPAWKSG